jgi:hypothetical protein
VCFTSVTHAAPTDRLKALLRALVKCQSSEWCSHTGAKEPCGALTCGLAPMAQWHSGSPRRRNCTICVYCSDRVTDSIIHARSSHSCMTAFHSSSRATQVISVLCGVRAYVTVCDLKFAQHVAIQRIVHKHMVLFSVHRDGTSSDTACKTAEWHLR